MRSASQWVRRSIRAAVVLVLVGTGLPAVADARAAAAPMTWRAPTVGDSFRGGLTSVSCPTSGFCMAVGSTGRAAIYSARHWHPAVQVTQPFASAGFVSVSCTSPTFCVAVDGHGDASRFTGSRWSTVRIRPGYLSSVSCAQRNACFAVGGRYVFRLSGSTWSKPAVLAASTMTLEGVSCPTPHFCMALGVKSGGTSYVWRRSPAGWHSGKAFLPGSVGNMQAISCTSASFCVTVGLGESSASYNGRKWHVVASGASGGFDDVSVSCTSPTSCATVGTGNGPNRARRWNGHFWSSSALLDQGTRLSGVSCGSFTVCTTVDVSGKAFRFSSGHWSAPVGVDARRGGLRSVSCPLSSFCFAVDHAGNVLRWDGSRWSRPARIDRYADPAGLGSVACSSTSFCLAVFSAGAARVWDGHGWHGTGVAPVQSPLDLSCASREFCVAVDEIGSAAVYNGKRWSGAAAAVPHGGAGVLTTVSCPTVGFCMAANSLGDVNRFNGRTWATVAPIAPRVGAVAALSCSASAFCLAVTGAGYSMRWNGRTWRQLHVVRVGKTTALSCTTPKFCAATQPATVSYFNGRSWSVQNTPALGFVDQVAGLDCVGTFFCAAVGEETLAVAH